MLTLNPTLPLVDGGYDLVVYAHDPSGEHAAIHYPGRPLGQALAVLNGHPWITAVEIRPAGTVEPLAILHPPGLRAA